MSKYLEAYDDNISRKVRNILSLLDQICVVMVETSMSGNIGSAARAMKTMGIKNLVLVNPKEVYSDAAQARAAGAIDIIENAQVVKTLEEGVAHCNLVMGASARSRNLPWPLVNPKQAASLVQNIKHVGEDYRVALVFGRERSGLSNEELALCHHHIHIPSDPDYSSLNIAAAIQVITYEMRMAELGESVTYDWALEREAPPANQQQMEGFIGHLEETLIDIEFLDPNKPMLLMQRLRRLFMRALPDSVEINILRGILTKINKSKLTKRD